MAEYVNKAELETIYCRKGCAECKNEMCLDEMLRGLPTIDIITCKECKHYTGGMCRKIPMGFDIACYDQWVEPEDDFFCKYGERKDDDNRTT